MQSYKGRFEPTRFEDLTVTVDFHCHSACRFCIVQEGMNLFRGVSFDRFKQAVDDNGKAPRYRRVTFTGGEVTLEKKLLQYVDYAREHGGFDHIRVQTNGRRLADMERAKEFVAHGIDEFFVSLHGHNAEVQDYTSQREGSFDEAWRGMQNVKELGAVLMTNTVLTTMNADTLTELVETVAPLEPARMEFWNYLPMEDYGDERDLLVPMQRLGPAMRGALRRADELGLRALVKYVPRCLLGEYGHLLDNTQPDVVIVEGFYEIYPRFACIWEAKCEHAESCLGLTHPYIEKFGWDRATLVPVPRTTPWQEPIDGASVGSDDPLRGGSHPIAHHPDWAALVEGVAEAEGVVLEALMLDRRRCTFRFRTPAGSSVDLMLNRRSDDRPALARTQSFDLAYRSLEVAPNADAASERAQLSAVLRVAVQQITARDKGELMLDERKGLVGAEAFRRQPPVRPD
ncbi:MAG: radical SAM protein [Deltaproteobacteria bacterium]|nr:radical SAM protein [Deltaproteobacteria bacterium]